MAVVARARKPAELLDETGFDLLEKIFKAKVVRYGNTLESIKLSSCSRAQETMSHRIHQGQDSPDGGICVS
jgi:hypothetical protein